MLIKYFYALFSSIFFLFQYTTVITNALQLIDSRNIQGAGLLSLPVCGDLVSESTSEDDGGSSEGASICAITSIFPSVCTAKAVSEVVKSIEHTVTHSKHRYLHIFFRFISDKTCGV